MVTLLLILGILFVLGILVAGVVAGLTVLLVPVIDIGIFILLLILVVKLVKKKKGD